VLELKESAVVLVDLRSAPLVTVLLLAVMLITKSSSASDHKAGNDAGQLHAQLEASNGNEDWQECSGYLQLSGHDAIAVTF